MKPLRVPVRPSSPFALLPLLALLAGCGGGEPGESAPPSAEPADPEPGGTIVIGIASEPDNLIDATSTTRVSQDIIDQMFLGLTELGPDLKESEPDLARSWDFSDDGLAVTFHLHPEARWHDGVPVTARDVAFTHDLLTDPVVGYAARSWKRFITEVVVDDEHTVTFRFDRRYPYQVVDASVGLILPRHLLEDLPRATLASSEFARHPVGNGPFRFGRWEAQQLVELVANDDFFLGRPHLDRVVFRVIPEKTSLVTQLETGAIDVLEDVSPHEAGRLAALDHVRIEAFSGRSYTYIGWDSTNPLFESPHVRRALGMAIDRQEIMDALCYGYARPIDGPIHPMLWAHNPDLPSLPFDPEAAARILEEEGWRDTDGDGVRDRDGVPFAFELKTNLGNQVRMDASVMIQSMLRRIGVAIEPRTYEWNVLWGQVIDHSYGTAVLVGWSVALKVDMQSTFHSRAIEGKYNHTSYSNPEVDELIDEAVAAATFEEARPLWMRAQELIVRDQPYTFLFRMDSVYGVNERVRGTAPDPRGYYRNLREWWVPAARRRSR
jgi:peptide/nickel transport system substrate-binding protein